MEITVPPLGAEFTLGGAVFEFVGPVSDWGGDVNDSSLVLRLDYGGDSFLFTGDIGSGPLEDCAYVGGYDLDCDVLKLGHHGSSTSTDQGILDLTTPEVAVASLRAGQLLRPTRTTRSSPSARKTACCSCAPTGTGTSPSIPTARR